MKDKTKIAIIGCRGIPAKYGGFETFAQGLTENLVQKEYDITVSCEYESSKSREMSYKGAKLDYFPIKPPKNYFLRKFYENLSDIYFLFKLSRNNQLLYFLGVEVGMFLFIPKILNWNLKLIVNIDGIMWKRSKFNRLERWLLKINHYMAILFADKVVVDSQEMKNYVDGKHLHKTTYISYGINIPERITWNNVLKERLEINESIQIIPGNFLLVVARLEPENNIHTIVEAYLQAKINIPLVVVGDFTSLTYQDEVKSISKNYHYLGVIFLGSIYDEELLNMLRQNCTAYIHGHSVGGTNPSLLEAAISRNIIIAHDNPFNREVCGKFGIYFKNSNELARKIRLIHRYPKSYQGLKTDLYYRVKNNYLWDKISGDYLSFFNGIGQEKEEFIMPMEINYDREEA